MAQGTPGRPVTVQHVERVSIELGSLNKKAFTVIAVATGADL